MQQKASEDRSAVDAALTAYATAGKPPPAPRQACSKALAGPLFGERLSNRLSSFRRTKD
jgi:hypothetical protein